MQTGSTRSLKIKKTVLTLLNCLILHVFFIGLPSNAQSSFSQDRALRYTPEGDAFVINNGTRKFNRALYGTNTGYRTEAGDLPEFALYMPGMGGNLRFALLKGDRSVWVTELKSIKATYRPGSMLYEISDPQFLGNGKLLIHILSSADKDGLILKADFKGQIDKTLELAWVFGGASNKKFSRAGDIGADPESSFYLSEEGCIGNEYTVTNEGFVLRYGTPKPPAEKSKLTGIFPKAKYKLVNGIFPSTPSEILNSEGATSPAFSGRINAKSNLSYYFTIYSPETTHKNHKYEDLPRDFDNAEKARTELVNRVKINTPDPYLNTLGGSLAAAADGIWETPTFLHGAVAWRMRLNAWRGAYVADVLGWHDRAKLHFSSYANSQVLSPENGPIVPDTLLNMARQKEVMGTSMFSAGYISRNPNANDRPHHYNMNLVFFDQIYTHFNWTRDIEFLKTLWPTLERNITWEKRNFDADGDGLYDAYASIWASDALQYNGGGVTHTTAYNYRANIEMAKLARILGKDPTKYENESKLILEAVQKTLWLKDKGWYAEYIDATGNKILHEQPGLWSIYHAIDSKVPNSFETYQSLRYIDTETPKIPIKAQGLKENDYFTLSTSNWQPYTWSVNNVALAELMHTSLAYWQGNRSEEAFKLWKSSLLESMYLGASPGNFQQLSYYDAMRGELYRDFADPIGMVGRTLVEGLFGIQPDAFNNTLLIQPGLPREWDYASLDIPDAMVSFNRKGDTDTYKVVSRFSFPLDLKLQVKAFRSGIKNVWINGKKAVWSLVENAVGLPEIIIECGNSTENIIQIEWEGKPILSFKELSLSLSEKMVITTQESDFLEVMDPQGILENINLAPKEIQATLKNKTGEKTIFVKVKQGDLVWYKPYHITIRPDVYLVYNKGQAADQIDFDIISSSNIPDVEILVNPGFQNPSKLGNLTVGKKNFTFSNEYLIPGSNRIVIKSNSKTLLDTVVINWNVKPSKINETVHIDLATVYNDRITRIFDNLYETPRPFISTLQLPTQGIGNWCYPLIKPILEDEGLRNKLSKNSQKVAFNEKIAFGIRQKQSGENVVFTSKWDNFPDKVTIPLEGNASHVYLLMGGTTNPMQSRIVNGTVTVEYTDGSHKVLELKNPENWWPIEQDYYIDDYAFAIETPSPPRLHLKTGDFKMNNSSYYTIKGFSSYGVDGGAVNLLDIPLDKEKRLKSISIETKANDVVIGLMGLTLLK